MLTDLPILGICGWSGSGKTTLVEQALPRLLEKGLKIAVVKHDAHGIEVDRPGKDSDRFFRAGADVLLQGPEQEFFRIHKSSSPGLTETLNVLSRRYDLVLVEGHKKTPLPKVWLLNENKKEPPSDIEKILAVLPRDSQRCDSFMSFIEGWLSEQWLKTPVLGCVLIGGKSKRMGKPKHLLMNNGKTWLEQTIDLLKQVTDSVVLAGQAEIPESLTQLVQLPDSHDAKGPMAGILAAMRWNPKASWIVTACDLPNLTLDALEWLVSTRMAAIWATVPKLDGGANVEPLLAFYDFRASAVLEQLAGENNYKLSEIKKSPKVISPTPPSHLMPAWKNINTEADLKDNACQ